MPILPQLIDSQHYWRDIYKQPLSFWEPAIARIAAAHGLPAGDWARVRLGRNIVFCSPTTVVKLGPPCWPGEMAREAAALRFVAGRLPVATPTALGQRALDGWDYIVQDRLSGTPLWELWPHLPPQARADLAYQHGRLMAAVHSLALDSAPPVLQLDWQAMLAEQSELCAATMQDQGVDPALVSQVEAYLAATTWSIDADSHVLLHGDLNHLNFLVSADGGAYRIIGIIDWGDVKIGPPSHEFISPGVHMYKGNRALLAQWYRGYGLPASKRTEAYEHVIMARSMLYYADDFPQLIQTVEGAAGCQDWASLARCFWHIT